MARSYANLQTAIWLNRDFTRLSTVDQQLYLLLVSQSDITAVGTLPLTVHRWADLAADSTVGAVAAALDALSAARFVGVDTATEEIVVRTFVRHDKGYGNPKRRPSIVEAARHVRSVPLRAMLREEFRTLGLPLDCLSDSHTDSQKSTKSDTGTFPQVEGLSDRLSPSQRVVSTFFSSSSSVCSSKTSKALGPKERAEDQPDRKKPARRLPPDWTPTDSHRARAAAAGLDLTAEVESFTVHAETHDRRVSSWHSAFTQWLIKSVEFRTPRPSNAVPASEAAALAWVRAERDAARIVPVQERTGMRYREPDLPWDVTGRAAVEAFHLAAIRAWFTANEAEIVARLVAGGTP